MMLMHIEKMILFIIISITAVLYIFIRPMSEFTVYGGAKKTIKKPIKFFKKGTDVQNKRAFDAFNLIREKIDNNTAVVVDDIPDSIPYEALGQTRLGNHFGQRKLGLSEIQFFNEWSKISDEPVYCVYAGAAPSNKTHILVDLFPKIKLILVDPNKFEIMVPNPDKKGVISHRAISSQNSDIIHLISHFPTKSKEFEGARTRKIKDMDDADMDKLASFVNNDDVHNIYVMEDYFDESGEIMASFLKRLNRKIIFVSDIRSNVSDGQFPSDFDIIWNTAMMFNWIKSIRPEYSMIKFRLPFFGDTDTQEIWKDSKETFEIAKSNGIDFVADNDEKKFRMFGGKPFLQVWPGRSSTELRLHTTKDEIDNIIEYDIASIEAKLNYYNIIYRTLVCHTNPNSDKKLGFCLCNDCAIENSIWTDYICISNSRKPVSYYVREMDGLSRQALNRRHEHQIYKPFSDYEVVKLFDYGERMSKMALSKGHKNKFGKQRGNKGKA